VILLGLLSAQAFAQTTLSDKGLSYPGIKWDWKIKAENYIFDVSTVSNYDMKNATFNKANKELIFTGNSTHSGNVAEIVIPRNLIGGNLTVMQNGKVLSPIILLGTDSSTIILKYNDTGLVTISVMGATYLPEFSSVVPLVMVLSIIMVLFTLRLQKS
jgi:hypothetical protein